MGQQWTKGTVPLALPEAGAQWETGQLQAPGLSSPGRLGHSLPQSLSMAGQGAGALGGLGLFLYLGRKMSPADGTIKEQSGD